MTIVMQKHVFYQSVLKQYILNPCNRLLRITVQLSAKNRITK